VSRARTSDRRASLYRNVNSSDAEINKPLKTVEKGLFLVRWPLDLNRRGRATPVATLQGHVWTRLRTAVESVLTCMHALTTTSISKDLSGYIVQCLLRA